MTCIFLKTQGTIDRSSPPLTTIIPSHNRKSKRKKKKTSFNKENPNWTEFKTTKTKKLRKQMIHMQKDPPSLWNRNTKTLQQHSIQPRHNECWINANPAPESHYHLNYASVRSSRFDSYQTKPNRHKSTPSKDHYSFLGMNWNPKQREALRGRPVRKKRKSRPDIITMVVAWWFHVTHNLPS